MNPRTRIGITPLLALLASTALLSACAAPVIDADTPMPERFAVSLFRRSTDSKLTYFVLERDGKFSFGGGRDAIGRTVRPEGRISLEQRQQLWDIVRTTGLAAAKDHPFAKHERVSFELSLDGDGWSRTLHLVDDDPGAAACERLHDALMKIHTDQAYDRLNL